MTRINVGIPVDKLSREHLIAEHREIKRIPNMVRSGRAVLEGIPDRFTLGKGHVRFFYDKLLYLLRRYEDLYAEGIRRGYSLTYFGGAWEGIPDELMGDYDPTAEDGLIVLERIRSKAREPAEIISTIV